MRPYLVSNPPKSFLSIMWQLPPCSIISSILHPNLSIFVSLFDLIAPSSICFWLRFFDFAPNGFSANWLVGTNGNRRCCLAGHESATQREVNGDGGGFGHGNMVVRGVAKQWHSIVQSRVVVWRCVTVWWFEIWWWSMQNSSTAWHCMRLWARG